MRLTFPNDWFENYDPRFSGTEVIEEDDRFLVQVDLPGVKKEDIQIDVLDGVLSVTGQRHLKRRDEKMRFQRRFQLPRLVQADQIEAHLDDGVLSLVVPKAPTAQPKKIEIRSGRLESERIQQSHAS